MRDVEGSTIAMHTLEVVGLLVLILGCSSGTFFAALVGLAYSSVGCGGVSVAALDTVPEPFSLKPTSPRGPACCQTCPCFF